MTSVLLVLLLLLWQARTPKDRSMAVVYTQVKGGSYRHVWGAPRLGGSSGGVALCHKVHLKAGGAHLLLRRAVVSEPEVCARVVGIGSGRQGYS